MIEPSLVTRSSLRHVLPIAAPMPMPMAELPTRTWSDDEWERIKFGYEAYDMDEKWNVFVEDQVAGLRLVRLRRGRSGSRMAGAPSAGHGPWVVAVGAIPPAIDPGEPSRPPPGPPASVRAVKVRLTWRAGRWPAPQEGGSMADGMARWARGEVRSS